jgi:4-diphosphocytidyl-2C-methyl-D-erythritol kinase
MKEFTLPAYAKINWFLRILGKRGDGFHELCTAFQTVSLHDNLTFSENEEIVLTCDDAGVPVDESNLIVKAARELQRKFEIKNGARIHLEKRIPSPGGLGGGSSDAATALRGLARLWRLEIGFEGLFEIAARLGSDVPFFLYGGTALGTGRGTEIFPVDDVEEKFLLIVTPAVEVPTKEAFERLNAQSLTNIDSKSNLKICREELKKTLSRHFSSANDFEKVIFEIEPEIRRVKEKLLACGAVQAHMSGSGASVYAVFENEETRQATLKALQEEENWRKFAVATISRADFGRETVSDKPTVVSD